MDTTRQLDPAVRERLFAIATAAFAQHGYGASLNAILADAGMGKSSFFHYFIDKEDLFAAVLEAAVARVAEAVGSVTLPTNRKRFWPDAISVIARWGDAADAEPGFINLLQAFQQIRRTAGPRLSRAMNAAWQVYRSLLDLGVELGAVRRDLSVDTMMALTEAIDLAMDDEFARHPAPDAAAVNAHRALLIDVIQRLLRP